MNRRAFLGGVAASAVALTCPALGVAIPKADSMTIFVDHPIISLGLDPAGPFGDRVVTIICDDVGLTSWEEDPTAGSAGINVDGFTVNRPIPLA